VQYKFEKKLIFETNNESRYRFFLFTFMSHFFTLFGTHQHIMIKNYSLLKIIENLVQTVILCADSKYA